ncbi:MAG: HPr(Ser) kinase/phosphatase [Thermodesulfobacteriota bacterium]
MSLPVGELLEEKNAGYLGIDVVAGEKGLARTITTPRIQKPGLLLTGMLDEELHQDRIQIFGAAEVGYINNLCNVNIEEELWILDGLVFPAIIVTRGLKPPEILIKICRDRDIPLFVSRFTSSVLIDRLTKFLEEKLAPSITLHGVLLDVLGVGVFIIGKSGIGKSECALDLVARGYRLVSDDVVIVKKMPPGLLFGTSSDIIRYHMEIRGLGIVNIKDLYGITAIRETKQMDVVVELVSWESDSEYERLGFDENTHEILGVELPYMKVPVSSGRSVATIVEVAARNQILKIMGHNSARTLELHLDNAMKGLKGRPD